MQSGPQMSLEGEAKEWSKQVQLVGLKSFNRELTETQDQMDPGSIPRSPPQPRPPHTCFLSPNKLERNAEIIQGSKGTRYQVLLQQDQLKYR